MPSLTSQGVKWHLVDAAASTDPTELPLTLEEFKDHIDVDHQLHDTTLEAYLQAAAAWIESRVRGGIKLINHTYDLVLDSFPDADGKLEIPIPPLSSITSISYYDATNSTTAMASTNYRVITPSNRPGYVVPRIDGSWPATYTREDAITVRFVAGFGATSTSIPPTMKQAMRLVAGYWYDQPEAGVGRDGTVNTSIGRSIEQAVEALLASRGWGFYA